MPVILTILLIIGLAVPVSAKEKVRGREYKGKVYSEIRIDDKGIILIDSLGNQTEVIEAGSAPGEFEDHEAPVPPVEPGEAGLPVPPDFYRDTLDGIKKIGGSVIIEENEFVDGDVVVVGNATIKGRVRGSVTATGRVRISSTGIVDGDVAGSKVIEEAGSRVFGMITEQPLDFTNLIPETDWRQQRNETSLTAAIVAVSLFSFELLLTLGLALIFPKPTDRLKEVFTDNIFKALAAGFLAEILFLPGMIILCITIIGIPIAILGLPLGFLGAAFLGFASFCLFVSDYIKTRNGEKHESRIYRLVIGFAVLQIPWAGFFLGFIVDSEALSIVCLIAAIILTFIVTTASLGAAVLTRFGSRDHKKSANAVQLRVEVSHS